MYSESCSRRRRGFSSSSSCSRRQPLITGREISDRLGIDPRTVRRYVEALQKLGIPVEGQRGVGGGYRIRPGYRLPPLMLTDDEAVAVALGVQAAGRLGLSGSEEAVEGALAKIHRVLPDGLRRRVEALEATLDFTSRATPERARDGRHGARCSPTPSGGGVGSA